MIERIIDAEYTAEKQEGTVPPCENSVVEVSATYQKEITLGNGESRTDIDTTDLMVGSIVYDGGATYRWDGEQWVEVTSGGGGGEPVEIKFYQHSSKGWTEIREGATITVEQESSIVVGATDAPIVGDVPSFVKIEAESSDTAIATVEIADADHGSPAEIYGVDEGTAEITLTVISTGETFHFNADVPGK